MTLNSRVVSACLIGLAIALIVVGVVSGTLLRHVVQILPIILAAIVLQQRPPVGAYAALPIFLFWLLIVVLIWLFLLGISRIASGHYTVIEITCTVFMAAFSVLGALRSITLGRELRPLKRVVTFVTFVALQVAVMWVSFQGPIANR